VNVLNLIPATKACVGLDHTKTFGAQLAAGKVRNISFVPGLFESTVIYLLQWECNKQERLKLARFEC
jgi:hypothetical protein